LPDFLSPRSLKAEPNQLVCRNYRAINNEVQSAAAETGGGEARVMGPLLSACAAQDAGASDLQQYHNMSFLPAPLRHVNGITGFGVRRGRWATPFLRALNAK